MVQVTGGSPGERLLVAEELSGWSTFWKSGKPNRCSNAFFDASCRIGAAGSHPAWVDRIDQDVGASEFFSKYLRHAVDADRLLDGNLAHQHPCRKADPWRSSRSPPDHDLDLA